MVGGQLHPVIRSRSSWSDGSAVPQAPYHCDASRRIVGASGRMQGDGGCRDYNGFGRGIDLAAFAGSSKRPTVFCGDRSPRTPLRANKAAMSGLSASIGTNAKPSEDRLCSAAAAVVDGRIRQHAQRIDQWLAARARRASALVRDRDRPRPRPRMRMKGGEVMRVGARARRDFGRRVVCGTCRRLCYAVALVAVSAADGSAADLGSQR